MHIRFRAPALAVAGALAVVFGVIVSAGQAAPYRAPRGPDGKPNLNGIWQALNEADWDIEGHSAGPGRVMALGAEDAVIPGLGVVEGGPLPYLPAAAAKKKANFEKRLTLDPEIKCYLPGVPRATYLPYPFQILQNASRIFFAYEYAGAVRDILLKDPGPAPVDSWMGQSVGHWEGETLVVDVTGMNDQTWFDRAGNFHSDAVHVVERYTRTSADVITYEAVIEDPKVFTRPWKIRMPLYRRQDTQILDFKCPEFVEELLYGPLRKKPLAR